MCFLHSLPRLLEAKRPQGESTAAQDWESCVSLIRPMEESFCQPAAGYLWVKIITYWLTLRFGVLSGVAASTESKQSLGILGTKTFLHPPISFSFLSFFFSLFLGMHLSQEEVPWLGAELELQLSATAMPYPSSNCHLHHSSWQCQILNHLSESRDRTHILMDTSWDCYHQATRGTPPPPFLSLGNGPHSVSMAFHVPRGRFRQLLMGKEGM